MGRNTMPSVIENHLKDNKEDSIIDFLKFKIWIQQNETESSDWIIVAQSQKINDEEEYFTFSALASYSETNKQKILSTYEWEIDCNYFGYPIFNDNGNHEITYDSGQTVKIKEIDFKPFIYYRNFHGYLPNTFEIIQNFIIS